MPTVRHCACFVFVVSSLGGATVAFASSSTSPAGTLASAVGCSSGWDQLLPASQRAQALEARGCRPLKEAEAAALAAQLSVYDVPVTHGPKRPLAGPQASPAPTARATTRDGAPPSRAAERPRGGDTLRPAALAPLIDGAARRHDIDPLLLHAIARVESRHQPGAISHAGAHGLMQVIVPTARRFGVDSAQQLHHPVTNLEVSARYLKTLQRRFGNDLTLVLAAYNAGEGAVEKYGRRIPPYRETQGYVRKVLAEYQLLRQVSLRRGDGVLARIVAEAEL